MSQPPGVVAGQQSVTVPTGEWRLAEQPPERKPRWYGWQTLAVDGAALLVAVVGARDGGAFDTGYLALGGYALGGPTVHLVHGRPVVALGSLGLRVGAPIAGAGIGLAAASCPDDPSESGFCGVGEAAVGFLVGIAAAVTIDAALLARKPRPRPAPGSVRLVPGVAVTPERRAIVLAGTF